MTDSPNLNQDALLARLDERTAQMQRDIGDLKSGYVTMDRYRTVEMLVYGQVAVMLLAIISAVMYVVIPRGG